MYIESAKYYSALPKTVVHPFLDASPLLFRTLLRILPRCRQPLFLEPCVVLLTRLLG